MSMSKVIDNLDTAAQAAGYAMVGSEDNFTSIEHGPAAEQLDAAPAKFSAVAEQARAWLRQMAAAKPQLSFGSGWSPWKATA